MPAHADALTFLPFNDVAADRIDESCDFMTRHARILERAPQTLFDEQVAVANAARLLAQSRGECPGEFAGREGDARNSIKKMVAEKSVISLFSGALGLDLGGKIPWM